MKTRKDYFYADKQKYHYVPIEDIKPLKGFSRGFLLATDWNHNSSHVAVVSLTLDDMRDDTPSDIVEGWTKGEVRRALAFGRENAKGHFISVKWLADHFRDVFNLRYWVSKSELASYKSDIDKGDFGFALENWLCAKMGYTFGTPRQDRYQKIDVIGSDGSRWQCKCSIIPTESSKRSYSKTNGSVFED